MVVVLLADNAGNKRPRFSAFDLCIWQFFNGHPSFGWATGDVNVPFRSRPFFFFFFFCFEIDWRPGGSACGLTMASY